MNCKPIFFVQALEPGAKARDLLAGTKLVSEPGFAGATTSGGDELQAVWSPDGQSIVFVAMTNRNAAAYSETNTDLFQVSANGGEPRRLTSGENSYFGPRFSPDGTWLYCNFVANTVKGLQPESNCEVYVADNDAIEKILTANFDRAPSAFAVTPDSKTIYLLAEEAGNEKLYSVPADRRRRQIGRRYDRGVYTNLAIPTAAPSTMLFANWESAINPAEVVRIDLERAHPAADQRFQWRTCRPDCMAAPAAFLVYQ